MGNKGEPFFFSSKSFSSDFFFLFFEKNSWTPLYVAARSGHRVICKMLLDKGAMIESKSGKRSSKCSLLRKPQSSLSLDENATPLYVATEYGQVTEKPQEEKVASFSSFWKFLRNFLFFRPKLFGCSSKEALTSKFRWRVVQLRSLSPLRKAKGSALHHTTSR